MDSKTYIANAIRTESVPATIEINQVFLHAALELMIAAAKVGDLIKRKIFYGQNIDPEELYKAEETTSNMAELIALSAEVEQVNAKLAPEDVAELSPELASLKLSNLDPRLLHAGLGIFTEAGELLESLKKAFETGVMDKVNFGEEIGDVEWYQAIGFDATGVTEASCREKNIAKLRKRYPEKFDAHAAVNRDLAAERAILEGDDSSAVQDTKAA